MYGLLVIRLYIYISQSLEKIQLESKLYFAFVSFPYKLNCLGFCYYFFFELIEHIFYTVSIQIFCMRRY